MTFERCRRAIEAPRTIRLELAKNGKERFITGFMGFKQQVKHMRRLFHRRRPGGGRIARRSLAERFTRRDTDGAGAAFGSDDDHRNRLREDVRQNPEGFAVFLDFDGTLVDIASTPDGVLVPDDLKATLTRLASVLEGALAILTGRQIADIDRFLGPLNLIAAGVHGAEMRTSVDADVVQSDHVIEPEIAAAIWKLAEISPGIIVENKRASMAVHYRLAPDARTQLGEELRSILRSNPDRLVVRPGRKVFEVLPLDVSKGKALGHLMTLPVFKGRRPIMIGDDVSDESAFEAAVDLGGHALRVAGEHFSAGIADFRGVDDVLAWLTGIVRKQHP